MPMLDNFRRNLAAAIRASGLSKAELARRSNIHVTTISRIIHGHMEPTVSTCETLAKAAELPLEKAFSEKSEKRR